MQPQGDELRLRERGERCCEGRVPSRVEPELVDAQLVALSEREYLVGGGDGDAVVVVVLFCVLQRSQLLLALFFARDSLRALRRPRFPRSSRGGAGADGWTSVSHHAATSLAAIVASGTHTTRLHAYTVDVSSLVP